MRRSDREVTDRAEIDAIVRGSPYCTLAICAGKGTYAVPLSFGYDGERVYFHCATEGHKLDLLRANPHISLAFVSHCQTVLGDRPCFGTTHYSSALATGTARFVLETEEKVHGLDAVMAQCGAPGPHDYPDGAVETTEVIAIDIDEITGKRWA